MKKKIIMIILLLALIAGSIIFLTHTTEPEDLQSFQCWYYPDDGTEEEEEENIIWHELTEEDKKNAILMDRPEVVGNGKAGADMYPEGYYQKGVLQCNIMLKEGTVGIQLYDEDLNLLKEWTGLTSGEKSFTDVIEGDIVSNCRYTVIAPETDLAEMDGSVQIIITATKASRWTKIKKSIQEKMK